MYAQQAFAVLGEAVVGETVAEWLGDSDAVGGGAIHESEFGEFSHALGAEITGGDISLARSQVLLLVDE